MSGPPRRVSLGSTTLANYRSNGLGFRIMAQYDLDADESLEDDERRYFAYDERWRVVAAFKNSSTHPKERYVHHAAGLRGLGGSSYIDSVVLRDRETAVPWTGSSPSGDTLGERRYYAQNWRADVVAILATDADVLEWITYSSYGVPHSIPKGDYDLDGDVDAADTDALDLMISGAGGWNLDFNRDGNIDQDDVDAHAAYRASYSGGAGGRGVQSRSAIDNTLGYAGYTWDGIIGANHVRHRVYLPDLGRWTRRDPLGYVDGASLHGYSSANPVRNQDPLGLYSMGGSGLLFQLIPPGTQCNSPGYYYDPSSDQCVKIANPWDCAATSTSYRDCYACCNTRAGDWPFLSPCYASCNSRFNPPPGKNPFLPSPGPGGPCFRESTGGHPACGACGSGRIDALLPGFFDPSGQLTNICCICDVSHPNVSACSDIAGCAVARMTCLADNLGQGTMPCRMVPCIDKQLECLRAALATSPACQDRILQETEHWEKERKNMSHKCRWGR